MILRDMNLSWTPPADMTLHSVRVEGGYILVKYWQPVLSTQDGAPLSEKSVVVFINEMGREVMRTETIHDWPQPVYGLPGVAKKPEPTSCWTRFKNGFFMMLIGIEEMIQCRKKS